MKAFKAFEKDLSCRGFSYKVGETYTHKRKVIPCKSGFHACAKLLNCFEYYQIDSRICEVELSGEVIEHWDKHVASEIKIVRELSREEIEAAIAGDARLSYLYALNVVQGPWAPGEDAIAKDSRNSYCYSRDIIKGRWPKGEAAIAKSPGWSYHYARYVIQGP